MSIKILSTGDIHLNGGFETEEAIKLLEIAEYAFEHNCDVVTIGGDIFESVSTPVQRLVFQAFLNRIKSPLRHIVILRGNHDQAQDLMIFHDPENNIHVSETPETIVLPFFTGNLHVHTLPHFSAGALALQVESMQQFGEAGTNIFDEIIGDYFQKIRNHDGPSVVLCHAVLDGCQYDNGTIPRQNGIHLNADKLSALGVPVICNHIHQHQEVRNGVWYTGNPTRQNYGESQGAKGFMVLDWETGIPERPEGHWHDYKFVELDQTPMVLIEAHWNDIDNLIVRHWILCEPEGYQGAKVRFRYHFPQSAFAKINLKPWEDLFKLAKEVKYEPIVEVTTAVRCADMSGVQTVEDHLRVWIQNKELAEKEEAVLKLFNEVCNS